MTTALLCGLAGAVPASADVTRPAVSIKPAAQSRLAARGVYQTPAQAMAQAVKTGRPVPVTGATTPESTLTANPDGTWTETESGGPVRALADGAWKDLDAGLTRNGDGSYSPAVSSEPLTLSGGGTGPLAVMSSGSYSLALTAPMRLPAPVVSGSTAVYEAVLPGVNLIVTARADGGFGEVFRIASAKAAADPALRALRFRLRARGLTVRTAPDGVISAVGRHGQPVFSAPAPQMWDSTVKRGLKTMVNKAGIRVDIAAARPAASTGTGPGNGARTARLGVTLSPGTLTLTPPRSLLAGSGAVFPEYIDPTWQPAGAAASSWAYVSSEFPTQQYYDTSSALQVGLQPGTGTTSYAFYTLPLNPVIKDSTVNSATVYFPEVWADSCTASPVDLYLTGGISKSTTYDNQPSWGANKLGSDNVAYGWSSTGQTGGPSNCPYAAKDVSYDIKSTIAADAAPTGSLPSSLTFGLKAEDTTDSTGWKQFADPGYSTAPLNATMTITYAHAPSVPVLSTSFGANCKTGLTVTGDGNVILYATAKDADANVTPLSYTFAATADGSTFASNPTMTVSEGSGTPAPLELKAADLEAAASKHSGQVTVNWSATVSTGLSGVPTTSASCAFIFNDAVPGEPTVNDSGGSPACSSTSSVSYAVGTAASFTAQASSGTVTATVPVSYNYQLNGGDIYTQAAGASSPYSAKFSVTPTRITNVLDVTAVGVSGNLGHTFSCVFTAAPPAPAADQDLTGDGVPDVLTVGAGSTSLAPGLWLADGQAENGKFAGTVATTATDIAPLGPQDTGSPASWNGLQALTGQFLGPGFNDIEAYQPGTSDVYLLPGQGDGSATASNELSVTGQLQDTDAAGSLNYPLQLVNAYHLYASSNGLTAEPYPDQIGVFDDTANSSVGSYLAYFANSDNPNDFDSGNSLPYELTNASPDGTMDWNNWTITTGSDSRGGTSYIDMWLRNTSTGALYLWEFGAAGTGLTNISDGGFDINTLTYTNPSATLAYNQTTIYAGTASSSWDKGTALATFQAADINENPGLATVTSTGQVQSWQWNGTALTAANASGAAQTLLTADHTSLLNDGTGTVAADLPGSAAGDAQDNLTLAGSAAWNQGDHLFSPDIALDGTPGYLVGQSTSGDITPSSSFTISAWVKPAALGGTVLSQNGAKYSSVAISTTTSGKWQIEMDGTDTTASSYTTASGGTARAGAWADLTLTYSTSGGASILKLYVNGTESISLPDPTPPSALGRFVVGAVQANGKATNFFNGQVADVQTWNSLAVPAQKSTPGSLFVPVTPARILDTRSASKIGSVTGPVAASATITVPVNGSTAGGLPGSGVTAVAVAISVLAPTANGNIITYPAGTSQPVTAALPFGAGGTTTQNAVIPVGSDGDIALENDSAGTLQLTIDLTGYFSATSTGSTASTYNPLPTTKRILDTRNGTGAPQAQVAGGSAIALAIDGNNTNGAGLPASGITAVALTVTALPPASTDSGWLGIYPDGTTRPVAAELTYNGTSQSGTTIIVVPVGTDGKIDISNASTTPVNLTGDLAGYFTAGTGGEYYHPLASTRLLDTRQTTAVPADGSVTIPVPASVPADNPALILGITALTPTANGYLNAYPTSDPATGTATVNITSGQTAGDLAVVNTATSNSLTIVNSSAQPEQVIVDASGYFG